MSEVDWRARAEQAEALVGRLREDLSKARASMDAAANIIRGLEDDPEAIRVALAKLDFGRQEAKTALALADPLGTRLAEEQRQDREAIATLAMFAENELKHLSPSVVAAVERARGGQP